MPTRPVVVGAASRRHLRSHVATAPSFTERLRPPGGGVLSPPLDSVAPRGALEVVPDEHDRAAGLSVCRDEEVAVAGPREAAASGGFMVRVEHGPVDEP